MDDLERQWAEALGGKKTPAKPRKPAGSGGTWEHADSVGRGEIKSKRRGWGGSAKKETKQPVLIGGKCPITGKSGQCWDACLIGMEAFEKGMTKQQRRKFLGEYKPDGTMSGWEGAWKCETCPMKPGTLREDEFVIVDDDAVYEGAAGK
jgi:hypothetical protein